MDGDQTVVTEENQMEAASDDIRKGCFGALMIFILPFSLGVISLVFVLL